MRRFSILLAVLALAACASNPTSVATDAEQKAFAAYGTFVVFEEAGAKLVSDPTVSATVKSAIVAADAKAKPTADALLKAAQDYIAAQATVKAGGSQNVLTTASANLATWTLQAENDVTALVSAVQSK